MQSVEELKSRFEIPGRVEISMEPWNSPLLFVRNRAASAKISLYGGHLMSYAPKGGEDFLWLSKALSIERGKSIRGGVPVCWPWFGPHPSDSSMPVHGLARVRAWRLEGVSEPDEERTEIVLSLRRSAIENPPFPFSLRLLVSVGRALRVSLETRNEGKAEASFTAGLHTYFRVGDVSRASVEGLSGAAYWDKASDSDAVQRGPVSFKGKVDRIYHEVSTCELVDPSLKRRVEMASEGGRSIVVWNPGEGIDRQFPGFHPDDYKSFVCVEAANSVFDPVRLAPGDARSLGFSASIV